MFFPLFSESPTKNTTVVKNQISEEEKATLQVIQGADVFFMKVLFMNFDKLNKARDIVNILKFFILSAKAQRV